MFASFRQAKEGLIKAAWNRAVSVVSDASHTVIQSMTEQIPSETEQAGFPDFSLTGQEKAFLNDMLQCSTSATHQLFEAAVSKLKTHFDCEALKESLREKKGKERVEGWRRLHEMVWLRLWSLVIACSALRIMTEVQASVLAGTAFTSSSGLTQFEDLSQHMLTMYTQFLDNGLGPLADLVSSHASARVAEVNITKKQNRDDVACLVTDMTAALSQPQAAAQVAGCVMASLPQEAGHSEDSVAAVTRVTTDMLQCSLFQDCLGAVVRSFGRQVEQEILDTMESEQTAAMVTLVPTIAGLSLSSAVAERAVVAKPIHTFCIVVFRSLIKPAPGSTR